MKAIKFLNALIVSIAAIAFSACNTGVESHEAMLERIADGEKYLDKGKQYAFQPPISDAEIEFALQGKPREDWDDQSIVIHMDRSRDFISTVMKNIPNSDPRKPDLIEYVHGAMMQFDYCGRDVWCKYVLIEKIQDTLVREVVAPDLGKKTYVKLGSKATREVVKPSPEELGNEIEVWNSIQTREIRSVRRTLYSDCRPICGPEAAVLLEFFREEQWERSGPGWYFCGKVANKDICRYDIISSYVDMVDRLYSQHYEHAAEYTVKRERSSNTFKVD